MGQQSTQAGHEEAMGGSLLLQTEPEIDYHAQWRAFAIRLGFALFFLYTWLPVSIALFLVSRTGLHMPFVCLTIILLWFFAAIFGVYWAGEFRCPRCRRRYGALGHRAGDMSYTRGIFDKVCANCKLTKFERVR
jgi:hypothetical protein